MVHYRGDKHGLEKTSFTNFRLIFQYSEIVAKLLKHAVFLVSGVNTSNKFRTALLHMRQMFIESRARAFNLEDDGMESGDERDSGLRTGSGSDTASPLVSEWENDCNCHAQLPPAHVSSGDVSLHRFVCSLCTDIR